jgi:hypothetical protein
MEALLAQAGAMGARGITPKKVARWRTEDVLPPPISHGRGRGRGVSRSHDDRTLEQLVALDKILKRHRSLDYAAFRLWVRGYDVPPDRVRRALKKLILDAVQGAREKTRDDLTEIALSAEEKLAEHRKSPKQARKMAQEGGLAPLLLMMLQLLTGKGALSEEQQAEFARLFAEYASLDKARKGIPELKVPGWLTHDESPQLREMMRIIPSFFNVHETLTDEELAINRDLFRKYEGFVTLVELYQKAAKDEAALGMGILTKGPFGASVEELGPFMFTAIAVLRRANPELADKINEITAPVEATLEKIREAGIAVPQY